MLMEMSMDFEGLASVQKIEPEHAQLVETWQSQIGCTLAPCFSNGDFVKLFISNADN